MGRLSKYKRIKSCDPFSRNRSEGSKTDKASNFALFGFGGADVMRERRLAKRERKAARYKKGRLRKVGDVEREHRDMRSGLDVPPHTRANDFEIGQLDNLTKDRAVHNDIDTNKLLWNGVNELNSSAIKSKSVNIPKTAEDEARVARILRLGSHHGKRSNVNGLDKKKDSRGIEGPKDGESLRAFDKRVAKETRVILKETAGTTGLSSKKRSNPEKYEKKTGFLRQKKHLSKKRRKRGIRSASAQAVENIYGDRTLSTNDDDSLITGERAVAFLDQVERPPELRLLPRGAKRKREISQGDENSRVHSLKDAKKQAAEVRSMEILRNRVQAQYAVVKAKRRSVGDFHL